MVRWIGKRLAQRLKIGVQLFEYDLHIAPELITAFFQTPVFVFYFGKLEFAETLN